MACCARQAGRHKQVTNARHDPTSIDMPTSAAVFFLCDLRRFFFPCEQTERACAWGTGSEVKAL